MNEKNNAIVEEKQLPHLLNIINNTISRYNDAINRYSAMNNHLTGHKGICPSDDASEVTEEGGIIQEIIDRVEILHRMSGDFDNENNRLNKIVIDG